MNPARINMAIAEAVGWKNVHAFDRWKEGKFHADGCLVGDRGGLTKLAIPNYHGSLDAMAEAEKTLEGDDELEDAFICHLVSIIRDEPVTDLDQLTGADYFAVAHASAPQRALAFCRTLGLLEL